MSNSMQTISNGPMSAVFLQTRQRRISLSEKKKGDGKGKKSLVPRNCTRWASAPTGWQRGSPSGLSFPPQPKKRQSSESDPSFSRIVS